MTTASSNALISGSRRGGSGVEEGCDGLPALPGSRRAKRLCRDRECDAGVTWEMTIFLLRLSLLSSS